jgi:hypothetical protein
VFTKTITTLLAVLTMGIVIATTPAQMDAAPPTPVVSLAHQSLWDKAMDHKALIGGYVLITAAALGDWHSTIDCVRLPGGVCSEANPVLLAAGINPATARGSKDLLILKLAEPVGSIMLSELLRRKHWLPEAAITPGLWTGGITQAAVDIHNRFVIYKLEQH